jgi:23S rRNA-/tRNA-specific pseudouridylate synthase
MRFLLFTARRLRTAQQPWANASSRHSRAPASSLASGGFRDETTFTNGTQEPSTPGNFTYVQVRDSKVAHLIVDCREQHASKGEIRPHRFNHPSGQEENIVKVMAMVLGMSEERAEFLIRLGAVHLSAFPPPVAPAALGPAQTAVLQYSRDFVQQLVRASGECPIDTSQLQRTRRVHSVNVMLKTGNYLRVLLNPRRRPVGKSMTAERWRERVLYEDDHCVIVDKPAGIPTIPTVSNWLESMTVGVGHMLGYELAPFQLYSEDIIGGELAGRVRQEALPYEPTVGSVANGIEFKADGNVLKAEEKGLYVEPRPFLLMHTLQRLDAGTSGCVLLAKFKQAAWRLQKLFDDRDNIRKWYKVLCFSFKQPYDLVPPLPFGLHTHFLEFRTPCPVTGTPEVRTKAHDTMAPGLKKSQLVVHKFAPLRLQRTRPGGNGPEVVLWEVEVQLKTGRTHQIRAQIETFGLCVVGDEIYPALLWEDNCSVLDGRIGLQAYRLQLQDLKYFTSGAVGGKRTQKHKKKHIGSGNWNDFVAGEPWWRTDPADDVLGMVDAQLSALRKRGVLPPLAN